MVGAAVARAAAPCRRRNRRQPTVCPCRRCRCRRRARPTHACRHSTRRCTWPSPDPGRPPPMRFSGSSFARWAAEVGSGSSPRFTMATTPQPLRDEPNAGEPVHASRRTCEALPGEPFPKKCASRRTLPKKAKISHPDLFSKSWLALTVHGAERGENRSRRLDGQLAARLYMLSLYIGLRCRWASPPTLLQSR